MEVEVKVSFNNVVNEILEEKKIYVAYQPIFSLDNEGIYGYEGLTFTDHPNVVNIGELIEMAETVNKTQDLDLLMMEQVILSFKGEGKLFLNIVEKSVDSLLNYLEKMIQITRMAGIPMEDIVVEISNKESWDPESLGIIRTYKNKYNFQLAINDFGVGFSNSLLLLDVQPDIVKIDRVFVQKIYEDKRKHAFLRAFIEIIKDSNMKIFCEGIEEEEELNVLKILGSDYGQGYYLGEPKISIAN